MRIADRPVMVLHLPIVQLKYQSISSDKPVIFRSAVCALTAEESPVPTTARFHVLDTNKGLGAHDLTREPGASLILSSLRPSLGLKQSTRRSGRLACVTFAFGLRGFAFSRRSKDRSARSLLARQRLRRRTHRTEQIRPRLDRRNRLSRAHLVSPAQQCREGF